MQLTILKAHKSNYLNPISFMPGDSLIVGEFDVQYLGWVRVATEDGNEGWAPVSYISGNIEEGIGIATTMYNARELNVSAGDVVFVLNELNGWYFCKNSLGESGWIPKESGEIT